MRLKTKREASLYSMLEAQAHVATKSAKAYLELVGDFGNMHKHTERIRELEHEGDELTHELQNRIAATFITPLDKEDLKDLSQALDDVTDFIEAAAARAELYRVDSARPEMRHLAELLVQITELTEQAVSELQKGFRKSTKLKELLKDIHTVENESDKQFRQALSNLFHEPGVDALKVIKWKELFDRIETAVDKCEDIAAIIGTILIKYA
jgi:predicted phosphate transport protein (TIGR00153 family)